MEIGLHILFSFIALMIVLTFVMCGSDTTRCRTCKHFRLNEEVNDKEGYCKFDSVQGTKISNCDKCYCGNYEPGKYFSAS